MINEHELQLVNEMSISIYKRGYEEGVVETEKINDKAHNDGYNKGLYDAWEAAKKIHDGQIPYEVFGLDKTDNGVTYASPLNWGENMSPSEAIAKIKEYEEKQKQKRIANCITCKWDYSNYEKYLNVSEDEKVRHCNECYKNSGYEEVSTEMKSCSILEDDCPYDIKCEECEVYCSVERAKQKLKGDKEK